MPLLMERTSWKLGSVPGEVRLAFGRVGEGPEPVLALHGITAQHRAFNAAARHLRHPDGIAALDLRGRGDSEKPSSGSYGLDQHARDVIRTLDYLGTERGVLVGHSMGAFVALHTALSYPGRVHALVLLDGGFNPKASREAAEEDAASVSSESPTAVELEGVGCPVALVRAAEGFFPESEPLISDETREVLAQVLDLRLERRLAEANHYSMLFGESAREVANVIDDLIQQTR